MLPTRRPTCPSPCQCCAAQRRYTATQQYDGEFISVVREALLRYIEREQQVDLDTITDWLLASKLVKNVSGWGRVLLGCVA